MTRDSNDIVIISPNATLDFIYYDREMEFSSKTFYSSFCQRAGGSGINLSRALSCLGVSSLVHTCFGGHAGKMAKDISNREGLNIRNSIEIDSETRVTAIQYGKGAKKMSVSPSPVLSTSVVVDLLNASKPSLDKARYIFFGGSLSTEAETHDLLASFLAPYASKLVVDTRGEILKALIHIKPLCAKIDLMDGVFDKRLGNDDKDIIKRNCRKFHGNGVQMICSELESTLFAFFGGHSHSYHQFGNIKTRPYGRGDAFMAGIIYGLIRDFGFDRCMKTGIMAGSNYGSVHKGLGYIDVASFQSEMNEVLRIS